jgi:hypothetical protein
MGCTLFCHPSCQRLVSALVDAQCVQLGALLPQPKVDVAAACRDQRKIKGSVVNYRDRGVV